ncbi:unnamed protein product [Pleuronectes platessa]|uniref:Uncharacterized protein n=1 Tax=Pleuronectes platessa TaxID=8262 RepID=A0A9N7TQQ1_PLEPL|nr:unnamed protein product [Pleuronectes platessa]
MSLPPSPAALPPSPPAQRHVLYSALHSSIPTAGVIDGAVETANVKVLAPLHPSPPALLMHTPSSVVLLSDCLSALLFICLPPSQTKEEPSVDQEDRKTLLSLGVAQQRSQSNPVNSRHSQAEGSGDKVHTLTPNLSDCLDVAQVKAAAELLDQADMIRSVFPGGCVRYH